MTTRRQALDWWNNECTEIREMYSQQYFKRVWITLTGREIEQIWQKEENTNKYLDRLKQQYKKCKEKQSKLSNFTTEVTERYYYDAIRLFCLDCELVSFNDIEAMEYEVNQSF